MQRFVYAKVYCDLLRHPLFRDEPDFYVKLGVGLILEAREHTTDGVLRRMTAASVKGLCHLRASVPQIQRCIDYLVAEGWLIPHPDEAYELKDFIERQGRFDTPEAQAARAKTYYDTHREQILEKRKVSRAVSRENTAVLTQPEVRTSHGYVEVEEEVEKDEDQKALSSSHSTSLASQVFEHWKAVMGKPRAVLDKKRETLIKARLAEGRTADELCLAVDGYSRDPFSMGKNDRGQKYNDISLICRDAAHVEKFMPAIPPAGCEPAKPKRTHEDRMAIIEGQFGKSA